MSPFPIPKSPCHLQCRRQSAPAAFVSDRKCYAYIDIECSTRLGAPFCASAFMWTCLHLHSWLILSERWVCRVARGGFEQIINTSPSPTLQVPFPGAIFGKGIIFVRLEGPRVRRSWGITLLIHISLESTSNV